MNPITQHHPAAARAPGPGRQTERTTRRQVTGTYRVDGQASTGIFAGARGTGHFTVDVATGQDTLSGTLILIPPPA
jgi:hypothetical protein